MLTQEISNRFSALFTKDIAKGIRVRINMNAFIPIFYDFLAQIALKEKHPQIVAYFVVHN